MKNKKLINFLILFFFIIIIKNNNFFKDIYEIYYKDHSSRHQIAYDFCDYSGEGYIFYLKKKYNLMTAPEIISFKEFPAYYWIFNEINYSGKSDKLIILFNLDENNEPKFNIKNFKVIDNYKNNCLLLDRS